LQLIGCNCLIHFLPIKAKLALNYQNGYFELLKPHLHFIFSLPRAWQARVGMLQRMLGAKYGLKSSQNLSKEAKLLFFKRSQKEGNFPRFIVF
jgi:hypothetical protein